MHMHTHETFIETHHLLCGTADLPLSFPGILKREPETASLRFLLGYKANIKVCFVAMELFVVVQRWISHVVCKPTA